MSIGVLALWLYKIVIVPRPHWMIPTDVEMDVTGNALLFSEGLPIQNYWLPATPPIFLLGMIARWNNYSVTDIPALLAVGHVIVLLLTVTTIFWLTTTSLSQFSLLSSVTILLLLFTVPAAVTYLDYYAENPFLIPAGLLALGLIHRSLHATPNNRAAWIIFAGLMMGFGIAVKLLFLVLIPMPVLVYGLYGLLPADRHMSRTGLMRVGVLLFAVMTTLLLFSDPDIGRRQLLVAPVLGAVAALVLTGGWWQAKRRVMFIVVALFTYVSSTAAGFLIATLPARNVQARMREQAVNLLTRSGPYGSGEAARTSDLIENVVHNLGIMLRSAPLLLVTALLLMGWAITVMLGLYQQRQYTRLIIGLGLISTLLAALTAPLISSTFGASTSTISTRYLLPSGAPLVMLAVWLARHTARGHRLWWGVFMLVTVSVAVNVFTDLDERRQEIDAFQFGYAAVTADISELGDQLGRDPLILMGEVPHPVAVERMTIQQYARDLLPYLDAQYLLTSTGN